ncbi:hypothetical protein K144313037_p10540 (plasmid) [Clostridium tetani]|uniref:hypothetical protein n=1 Tax=Clostridium tetani TaxID=1513 RepID=UPI0003C0D2F4|nr:hypothetical protein [Clostridium tetani]CDI50877.1 hypothetical protein BN906_02928 [Clostridium tetani 12124569]AVP55912.1 hypothetical protein C3B72_12505 [Clostridium tetani]KGI36892.1 hypothetical protein LA33_12275 [Clostridium tetani ATCC 9441]KGI41504.1 hypothetical protein KY55_13665 [Clostridium tetani]RXI44002.1 hypothetical protein DP126_12375 [Clostridium tetani]
MFDNGNSLILIILASILCRIDMWRINKNYNKLLDEKEEDIYEYLYNLSKIQVESNCSYFFLMLIALLLLFK